REGPLMAAGLPGTGIGGLFFILSAFFMVIVELQRTIRGRSSLARWRLVGRHAGIAAAMVAAITIVIWLLPRVLFPSPTTGKGSTPATHALLPLAPVLITLAVLATVLLTAYLAQFVVRRESGPAREVADRQPSEKPEHRVAQPVERRPIAAMLQLCT